MTAAEALSARIVPATPAPRPADLARLIDAVRDTTGSELAQAMEDVSVAAPDPEQSELIGQLADDLEFATTPEVRLTDPVTGEQITLTPVQVARHALQGTLDADGIFGIDPAWVAYIADYMGPASETFLNAETAQGWIEDYLGMDRAETEAPDSPRDSHILPLGDRYVGAVLRARAALLAERN